MAAASVSWSSTSVVSRPDLNEAVESLASPSALPIGLGACLLVVLLMPYDGLGTLGDVRAEGGSVRDRPWGPALLARMRNTLRAKPPPRVAALRHNLRVPPPSGCSRMLEVKWSECLPSEYAPPEDWLILLNLPVVAGSLASPGPSEGLASGT